MSKYYKSIHPEKIVPQIDYSDIGKEKRYTIVCVKDSKVIGYWSAHSCRIVLDSIDLFKEKREIELELERANTYAPKYHGEDITAYVYPISPATGINVII